MIKSLRIGLTLVPLLLVGGLSHAQDVRIDGATVDQRRQAYNQFLTTLPPMNGQHRLLPGEITRLINGIDVVNSQNRVAAFLDSLPAGSSFGFEPSAAMHGYFLAGPAYSSTLKAKTKAALSRYNFADSIGNGWDNMNLLFWSAGLLAAEEWPDLVDAGGHTSTDIRNLVRANILNKLNGIVHKNFEQDADAYIYYALDFKALRGLAEFARDAEVRKRANLTLDWMMLNLACSWNKGYMNTTANRSKYAGSVLTSPDCPSATSLSGWFYYGGLRPVRVEYANGTGATSDYDATYMMSMPGSYQPPAIFTEIATARPAPYTHKGGRITANRNVGKTVFHSQNYSLASEYDQSDSSGSSYYKETRRTLLRWVAPAMSAEPSHSTFTVFQENPAKPYNLSAGKNPLLYGENPFSQHFQHERSLIGVCNVPPTYLAWKIRTPFTKCGAIKKRLDSNGWIWCHGGSMLFAFRTIKPYYWEGMQPGDPAINSDILVSDAFKNGWIIETAELSRYGSATTVDAQLDAFRSDVLSNGVVTSTGIDNANPYLKYKSIYGYTIEMAWRPHATAYSGQNKVNGTAVTYSDWPLLDNPWVHQDMNGNILTVKSIAHVGLVRTYDFLNWNVSETVVDGTYRLVNRANGKVLDNGGSTIDGTDIKQWSNVSSDNLRWTVSTVGNYRKLSCVTGGRYLDSLNHMTDGSTVGQWSGNTSNNQQWTLTPTDSGYFKIIDRANGKCLDSSGSTVDGAIMKFYSSGSSYNQQWRFIAP